ncbi:MAG: hypothetical protein HS104_27310 [Polyangiaceae bacterium]|nr:hypothetical protein [Polyangiaceae bacterium]MCE7890478.1 hypothetical protein [Sorangiineae bacterium PRO1]MCL4751856.1 hypothetical protein [Myxococcales bacterium]
MLVLVGATGSLAVVHALGVACAPQAKPAGASPESPPPAAEPPSALGHWRGYLEASADVASSDEIELVLTSAAPDRLGGSVRIGSSDAALPQDPTLDAGPRRFAQVALDEGKTLAITEGRADGARVRFDAVDRGSQEWCVAQVPGESGPGLDDFGCPLFGSTHGGGGCNVALEAFTLGARTDGGLEPDAGRRLPPRRGTTPGAAGDPDAGRWEPPSRPIDCAVLERCRAVQRHCECTGRACVGRPTLRLRFDIRIEGASADGSLQLDHVVRRVRLERVR